MRISIPISLIALFLTCGGTWWLGTRHYHFPTPPSTEEIDAATKAIVVRPHLPMQRSRASMKREQTVSIRNNSPTDQEKEIPLGDLTQAPALEEYHELAVKNPLMLFELAERLEALGHTNRAMLAWERVLDTTENPKPEQWLRAAQGVRNLRGNTTTWNQDPQKNLQLRLIFRATPTSYNAAKLLGEKLSSYFQQASSGFLTVQFTLEKSSSKQFPLTVILQGGKGQKITTSFKFSLDEKSTHALCAQMLQDFAKPLSEKPPHIIATIAPHESGMLALQTHITRRSWLALANYLKASPTPVASDEPKAKKR